MGKLRSKMLMLMEMKNFSSRTIGAYLYHMKSFVRMFGKSPLELGTEEICKYLHYLHNEKKSSWSNVNVGYSSIRFFYTHVLNKTWDVNKVPRPKKEKKLPVVLSQEEIKSIINHTAHLKYRTALMAIYSAGLRLNEAIHLKVADIDSKRMQIHICQGKGKKDRYTLLSKVLLQSLRKYYKFYRPKHYLFERKGVYWETLCPTTIQRAFKQAKKKVGLPNLHLFIPYDIPSPLTF